MEQMYMNFINVFTKSLGKDGIRMDLREIGWEERAWSGSSWLRISAGGGIL
jgi:hypothetical protein